MDIISLLLLAVGLSMDAFAVSICKGLAMRELKLKHMLIIGAWFGGFQALMPMLGYLLGSRFVKLINSIAPWIAFALLLIIGGNMIREAFSGEEAKASDSLGFKTMFFMAVATSIDALAVGITFACVPVAILKASALINTAAAVLIIGTVTFIISAAGVKAGNIFGTRYRNKAEFAGGLILILLGVRILLEHFGIISF